MEFLREPPTDKHTIDHIDVNKYNNSLLNLRWLDKRGQSYNKGETGERNKRCSDFLLTKYEYDSQIYKYLYRLMGFHKKSYEEACIDWSNFAHPQHKVKELQYTPSIEVDNMWYPDKSTFCKIHGVSLTRLKEGLSLGLNLQEIKDLKHDYAEKSRFMFQGYWMTQQEHCERLYVSHGRVREYMRKHSIPFEDAVKIPVQRITKHCVNDVVYNNKELFVKYGIEPRSANSYLVRSKERTIRETLEHYKVDTSEMEIFPCDGKDVIMYNNPI